MKFSVVENQDWCTILVHVWIWKILGSFFTSNALQMLPITTKWFLHNKLNQMRTWSGLVFCYGNHGFWWWNEKVYVQCFWHAKMLSFSKISSGKINLSLDNHLTALNLWEGFVLKFTLFLFCTLLRRISYPQVVFCFSSRFGFSK